MLTEEQVLDSKELQELMETASSASLLEEAFWSFHNANPEVYATLVRLTREWKSKRTDRVGIATVFETARYTLDIASGDDGVKLNNNHRAYYARLIMECEQDLVGIFQLRKQRIQSTLGPCNSELLSSEHLVPDPSEVFNDRD